MINATITAPQEQNEQVQKLFVQALRTRMFSFEEANVTEAAPDGSGMITTHYGDLSHPKLVVEPTEEPTPTEQPAV